jgi:putative transcription antitermination factor YqgF
LLTLELPARARAAAVAELAFERSVTTIVVGRPVRAGGEDSALWAEIRNFGASLGQRGFDVIYEDEAFTSAQAESDLGSAGSSPARRKARRPKVDAQAARLILDSYLERLRTHDKR